MQSILLESRNLTQLLLSSCRSLLVMVCFIISFAPAAHAANYYVATNGSDSNSGTLAAPWKTIAKAASTLVAGDTVYIRAGTYKEQVTPKNSGNALSGFITYSAYPGEKVTLDASGGLNWDWNGVFALTNRSYIQISGLSIINSPGFGVFMENSTNIKIVNNYIYNISNAGIYAIDSDAITIDGNEVAFVSQGGDQNNGIQESISLGSTTNFTVSNNRVHDGGMEGITIKQNASDGKIFGNTVYNMARIGIYVDADNIEIYNNTVSDSSPTYSGAGEDGIRIGAEQGGVVNNIKIYNNVLYNLAGAGINVDDWTESGYKKPTFSNISIDNNTAYNCGTRDADYGGGIDIASSSATGIAVRNNILSKNRYYPVRVITSSSMTNFTISNNLIETSTAKQDGSATNGTNAVIASPLFENAAGNNFKLQSTSPAIDAGTSQTVATKDFNLTARPQGGQVDIGAFEYGSLDSNPDSLSPPLNLVATASDSTTVKLSWEASTGAAGYKIYRDGTEIGTATTNSFTDTSVTEGNTYNYTIKAYDSTGNLSASSNTATVNTVGGTVKITSYSVTNITTSSATINWTTSTASTGVVSFGTRASKLSSQVSHNVSTTSHSVKITNLARNTQYYYTINANSGAAVSTTASFKTARRW